MSIGPQNRITDEVAEQLKAATELLEAVVRDRGLLAALSVEERTRLLSAAGDVFNPDLVARRQWGKTMKRQQKAAKLERDESVLAETGIRVLREKPVFTTPNVFPPAEFEQAEVDDDPEFREVVEPQHCYVCKQLYRDIHPFYDQLCPACGDFNYAKRTETADLTGRVALLTGGRVKIGYQAGIKLLRAGAQLIVTTRFPRDAANRYAQEADFDEWGDRLEVFGLDLRHTPSVEAFCTHLSSTRDRLDFIVNNACQTVRRPAEFYRHMLEGEREAERAPAEVRALLGSFEGVRRTQMLPSGDAELVPQNDLFPEGRLDQDLQQVDLRERNSWRLLLAEVSSVELLETQLVNAVAPFVLNARLKPLHAANARPGQAHRQRLGGRGAVLPPLQDHAPPAHEHGQGRAEHDDAHLRRRLLRRRDPHEQRRHRLGDRRGPGADRGAEDGGAPVPAPARHRRRRGAHRRPDHRRLQHRRASSGVSS